MRACQISFKVFVFLTVVSVTSQRCCVLNCLHMRAEHQSFLHFLRLSQGGNDSRIPVGQECVITVNTAQAGVGQVTCRIITPSGAQADVEIHDAGNGRVNIYYTPPIRGDYLVEVRFGGDLVPNGRFNQRVRALLIHF